jgi:hypothetical protein
MEWLAERGLTLSEEKTRIVHLTEGFDFLGFNIRHYSAPQTKPSEIRYVPFCALAHTRITQPDSGASHQVAKRNLLSRLCTKSRASRRGENSSPATGEERETTRSKAQFRFGHSAHTPLVPGGKKVGQGALCERVSWLKQTRFILLDRLPLIARENPIAERWLKKLTHVVGMIVHWCNQQ